MFSRRVGTSLLIGADLNEALKPWCGDFPWRKKQWCLWERCYKGCVNVNMHCTHHCGVKGLSWGTVAIKIWLVKYIIKSVSLLFLQLISKTFIKIMSSVATKICLSVILNVIFSKLRTQYPEAHICSRQSFSQCCAVKTRIHILYLS